MVLDEILLAEVGQRVGQGFVVNDTRAVVRHRVMELGVPQGTVLEDGQDRNVQLSVRQEIQEVLQVVRQRSSPPPNRARMGPRSQSMS